MAKFSANVKDRDIQNDYNTRGKPISPCSRQHGFRPGVQNPVRLYPNGVTPAIIEEARASIKKPCVGGGTELKIRKVTVEALPISKVDMKDQGGEKIKTTKTMKRFVSARKVKQTKVKKAA